MSNCIFLFVTVLVFTKNFGSDLSRITEKMSSPARPPISSARKMARGYSSPSSPQPFDLRINSAIKSDSVISSSSMETRRFTALDNLSSTLDLTTSQMESLKIETVWEEENEGSKRDSTSTTGSPRPHGSPVANRISFMRLFRS